MKVLFFLALLINIVFFLWEFNSKLVNTSIVSVEKQEKQILLLSELPKKELTGDLITVDNNFELHALENISVLYKMNIDQVRTLSSADSKIIDKSGKQLLEESNDDFLASIEKNSSRLEGNNELNALRKFFKSVKTLPGKLTSVDNTIDRLDKEKSVLLEPIEVKNQGNTKPEPEILKKETFANDRKTTESANNSFCYQIGPFSTQKKLNNWITSNKIDKGSVTPLNQDIKKVAKFLVYYPAEVSYAISKKNVRMLKRKGIKNYWLFRKGELKGAYSLGLFIKENRALALQKTLAKAGLKVEVMPRYKTTMVWHARILSKTKIAKGAISLPEEQVISLCDNI